MITLVQDEKTGRRERRGADLNKLEPSDHPVHNWYRFVLSYPPHLVRQYLEKFEVGARDLVLDPFCGTGTTPVECKKLGISSVGIEAHPMSHFASSTKVDWRENPDQVEHHAVALAGKVLAQLDRQGIIDDPQPNLIRETSPLPPLLSLPEEAHKLLLLNSISPLPLHKTLALLSEIDLCGTGRNYFRLALAKSLVSSIGNLHFGPEVGVGPKKEDAPVVSTWLGNVLQMVGDLRGIKRHRNTSCFIHNADSRQMQRLLKPSSVDAVITSPPYPNEKDYTRTTRLETVILGFASDKQQMRALKRSMLRSNTRGVYKEDADDQWVKNHRGIQTIAREIEDRRIQMGKTSGFERLYARVTKLYFGGMARHLFELRPFLRKGARLAYVVGDQASYLRVMIRTGTILASIAEDLGYVVEDIHLFRTRLSTATRDQLREEVVVLKWPGIK